MTVRVLIVDDSALIRQMLTSILSSDPEIEVIGSAPDPLVARQKIKSLNPDVITLDVEMPKMDGLSFLEKIMRLRPMPVVMVSTLTQKGADTTIEALEIGAVDFVGKPTMDVQAGMEGLKEELITKVKTAARARVQARADGPTKVRQARPGPGYMSTDKITAIGSSTGGVEALRAVLTAMPPDSPAILITQHMPGQFTGRFAERLNGQAAVKIKEAVDGERVIPGHVYIAPGDKHLKLARSGGNYMCKVEDGPLVSGHKPSVDVLFQSVAETAGPNSIGVILTGMGKDGAKGMLEMRNAGAVTLGQDEATSLVYGMPKAAKLAGAVQHEMALSKIADEILKHCKGS